MQVNEELSVFFTELWDSDKNKCEAGVDYSLDLQGFVTSTRNTSKDWAKGKLYKYFNEESIFSRPTYKAFKNLLDNYESDCGKEEVITTAEEKENRHFLDVVMQTDVMKKAHSFLIERGKVPQDVEQFKKLLNNIWFKLYKRLREDEDQNSSGFEHVFVGETRSGNVTGFHNWIQFYLQEKAGNVDYRGYFRRGTANEEHPRLITLQFFWKSQVKPIGSSIIGSSPEFELALYTVCFLASSCTKIPLRLKNYYLEILCHRHSMGIGSAYPISNE